MLSDSVTHGEDGYFLGESSLKPQSAGLTVFSKKKKFGESSFLLKTFTVDSFSWVKDLCSYQTVRPKRPRYAQPAYPFTLVQFANTAPLILPLEADQSHNKISPLTASQTFTQGVGELAQDPCMQMTVWMGLVSSCRMFLFFLLPVFFLICALLMVVFCLCCFIAVLDYWYLHVLVFRLILFSGFHLVC